jgi:uncharacterized protein with NRDE domain
MCLLIIAHLDDARYDLAVAANRDEMYVRPAQAAHFWEDAPAVLAGRDLEAGGTWMGVTRAGRFAALTNYREPGPRKIDAPSRGSLVGDFLRGADEPDRFLATLEEQGPAFNGFAMVFGRVGSLWFYTNRNHTAGPLPPGLHGLSNGPLDAPWPKVDRTKATARNALANRDTDPSAALFAALADRTVPPDAELPDTGVGLDLERLLAPAFVVTPVHGTRCSTVLLVDKEGRVTFEERSFRPGGLPGEVHRETFFIEPA